DRGEAWVPSTSRGGELSGRVQARVRSWPERHHRDARRGPHEELMPTLDEVSRIAAGLPGSEQRSMTGGEAWFVRNKVYAWECLPLPSETPELRELMISDPMIGVKVADSDEQRAYL